ncbi:unnamed protein product [Bursaphelenchus xylophilus]|uniref:(pine wood nematode) hypothetical protein n=1 Tax=Bursaphelenchus xylophilus TaxID=6326 RepID=A0A1I7RXQ3_BURXY|nr:unnamed protein product [Bursaphelenchus xylophilus]CAG9126651.1 unnamed protein product [Bursaphelenchus xylophilus]
MKTTTFAAFVLLAITYAQSFYLKGTEKGQIDQKALPFKMMLPPQKIEHKITPQLLLANQMNVRNAVYDYMQRGFLPMMGPNASRQFRQRMPFDDPRLQVVDGI